MNYRLFKILSISIIFLNVTYAFAQNKIQPIYLQFTIPVEIQKLDPILSVNAHSKLVLPLIFESLITLDTQQELQPNLAKSWQISADTKSIIITIHSGHYFSDHTEVTASDVANSLKRLCSMGSQEYGQIRGLIGCVEHAKGGSIIPHLTVIDKYRFKMDINSSPNTFLFQLSSPATVIAKIKNHNLIGSGPYLVTEVDKKHLTLVKNKFYFGNLQVKNDGIKLYYASGLNINNTIKIEKPDGALLYRMVEIKDFNSPNYKLIKSNPNISQILVINNQRFPFNKPLVRKALAAEIYNNFDFSCIPGSHRAFGIIPNGVGGSLANLAPTTLTTISPIELYKSIPELRYNKTNVTLHQLYDLKNDCETKQIITLVKKYNIDIKFKYHKSYSDLFPLFINHNLDGFIDLFIFKNREAYNTLYFFSRNGENDANITNNQIDSLLNQSMGNSTSHSRFQTYRKIAQYMQDNNIIIPLFYMDHGTLMNKCLSGITADFFFNPFLHLPQISRIDNCNN